MLLDSLKFLYKKNIIPKNATPRDEMEALSGPNHWVDHPDYENYFWDLYNSLFEHMYPSKI